MSDVTVPFGDDPAKTATLLLAAAEKAGEEASVVRTTGEATFVVDEKIAKSAGVDFDKPDEENTSDDGEGDTKTTAKKTAAKKTASKES